MCVSVCMYVCPISDTERRLMSKSRYKHRLKRLTHSDTEMPKMKRRFSTWIIQKFP